MNILILTQHFKILGGSDVIVHQTKRLLEQNGHNCYLFAAIDKETDDSDIFPSATHFLKPTFTNVGKFLYSSEAARKLTNFLEKNQIDIAYLHIYYGTLTSSILKPLIKRKIRIVQHLHEYRSFCSIYTAQRNGETCTECRVGSYLPGLLNNCNRSSLTRSALTTLEMYIGNRQGVNSAPDLFLAVSEFQRRLLIKQGLPAQKIKTLYNPVDPIFFETDQIDINKKNGVVFVGRTEEYKGVFDLLEVAKSLPKIAFTFIGDGSSKPKLRKKAANLRNVTIVDKLERKELLTYLSKNRMIVVPSKWNETFGLTAAEGMAGGLPAIVYNVGGLSEVVQDKESGFVLERDDIKALSKAIVKLSEDDSLCL